MKVLQSGDPAGAWKEEVKCTGNGNGNNGCGALLEVQAPDLFHTASFDYGGGSDHYITFSCPECNKWTDMKTHNIPYGVKNKILSEPHRVPT